MSLWARRRGWQQGASISAQCEPNAGIQEHVRSEEVCSTRVFSVVVSGVDVLLDRRVQDILASVVARCRISTKSCPVNTFMITTDSDSPQT